MRVLAVVALTLCTPLPAAAECAPGGLVFSCQIGAKVLELCRKADNITYSFGPPGAPELRLSAPLVTLDYEPWPGIGSSVWEQVTFGNGGYSYTVWTRTDRNFDGLNAGIEVSRGASSVASLYCDAGSASNQLYDTLYAMKESVGLCWGGPNDGWTGC
ncbi:MAG: hypothetical protein H3C51_10445 [Rubellimicrobium sp.]|nr:hypothetical protein [Rubellimicrobium sp.]